MPTKEARLLPKSNPGETSNQTQTEGHSIQVWPIIFKSVKGIKNKGKDELLQNEAARRGRTPYTWVTLNWISLLGKGGESNGSPLQYPCLENPMDGGAWWAAVHGVARSRTRPERLHFPFSLSCIGEGNGNPLQCSCLENPRDRGAWWAASVGSHRVGQD